jgi:hypothetical protein
MEDILKQLQRAIQSRLSLSQSEKDAQRASLTEFFDEHPAQGGAGVADTEAEQPRHSVFSLHAAVTAAALVLVLVGIGGTISYAAHGSFPGDPLYAVKIRINEPVRDALALSDDADANVAVNRAEQRLDEISRSVHERSANTDDIAIASRNLQQHMQTAETLARKARQQRQFDTALDRAGSAESVIEANERILIEARNAADSPQAKEALDQVVETLVSREDSFEALRKQSMQAVLQPSSTSTTRATAPEQAPTEHTAISQARVLEELDVVTERRQTTSQQLKQLSTSTGLGRVLHRQFSASAHRIDEARDELADGRHNRAFILLNTTKHRLHELSIIARAKLQTNERAATQQMDVSQQRRDAAEIRSATGTPARQTTPTTQQATTTASTTTPEQPDTPVRGHRATSTSAGNARE